MPPVHGVPPVDRPTLRMPHRATAWQVLQAVNAVLKYDGLNSAAEEFRRLAIEECPDDPGMIISLATAFVQFV